ncbi:TPA: glycosyltransferase family 4 protein [Raoultella ornithinolytica]
MIYINGRFLTQNLTGVQRFAYELTSRLSLLRDDVVILVPSRNTIRTEYLKYDMAIEEVIGGSGHYWEQVTLPKYLRKKQNPVLVNLCNTGPIFYKNQIVTHHDITYVRYPKGFPLKFKVLYKLLTPVLLNNAKAVITVSNFSKNEISDFYKIPNDKINVIYNSVNDEFKAHTDAKKETKNEDYFLAVSSINLHKNLHGLISAFNKTDLKIKLKIIGGSTNTFSKVNFINDDPRIEFLGRVDDTELIALYHSAKAFIFPSLYEGFGIPPLEAQTCCCPVISSDRASLKEVLGDSVIYFNPESKEEIISSLLLINSDDNIRNVLIERGKRNISRFSWDKSASQLNEILLSNF